MTVTRPPAPIPVRGVFRAQKSPTRADLLATWEEMGVYACYWCSRSFTPDLPLEVDHVRPLSRGGADTADNCVPACAPCNRAKGAMLPEEWVAHLLTWGFEDAR